MNSSFTQMRNLEGVINLKKKNKQTNKMWENYGLRKLSSVSVSVGAKYVIMKGQTWNHSLIKVAVVHACNFSLFFLQIIVRVWYCYWKPHLKMASINNFYYFISLYSSTLETWISSLNDFWDGEIFFPLWQPSGLPQSSSQFHCTLRLPFLPW